MQGAATKAVLAIARDVRDDRRLAELICHAYVVGLNVDGAALSLLTATDSRHTVYTTGATAETLEDLQFTLNEGVCIEAATTGQPVFVNDIRRAGRTTRWPMFAAAVLEETPVRALFALPLQWGTTNLGVLDLYRTEPDGLSDIQRRDALAATEAATLMMLTLRTDSGGLVDSDGAWLDPTVAGTAEIHQATGMVLMQLDVSAADALASMRARAFAEQRLLIDVARDVVARRLSFTDEDSSDG